MPSESFYLECRFAGRGAVLFLTNDNRWKFIHEDPGFDFVKHVGQTGSFGHPDHESLLDLVPDGQAHGRCSMRGISFPPRIVLQPRFLLQHQFKIGDAWAKALGYGDEHDSLRGNGHWFALATGPLVNWIRQYCEERTEEAKKLAVTLGINLAALVDPTGTLSLAGAVDASRNGDYLGCALNLLGAIPLLGKVAQAARDTQIAARLDALLSEIKVLTEWMQQSKEMLLKARMNVIGLAGTIKTVKVVAEAKAARLLENNGWIFRVDPKDYERLGLLAEEFEALSALAAKGYYFVARACNPERVRWLKWAAHAGVRTLSKPLWVKAKSLKGAGYLSGLVGFKLDAELGKTLASIAKKVPVPPGFHARFLENGGGKLVNLWKVDPAAWSPHFAVKDLSHASSHFLVETGGHLILVDAHGAAYVSDIDIVLVQRRLGSGAFAPPGMNVGRIGLPNTGGDNPALRQFWNDAFGKVHYPHGYEVIQHGEATGTVGNYKPWNNTKYGPFDAHLGHVREPVWNPEGTWDTEELIVAAPAMNLPNGVGYAKNWSKLEQFHHHNPLGEFRIQNQNFPNYVPTERAMHH